jgi:hypothetical protein
MTVDAIKSAIAQLPGPQRQELAVWFDELEQAEWDRQMERDLAPGGPGEHLFERLQKELETGAATSLSEGLRQRRDARDAK